MQLMIHVLFVCLGNICRSPMAEAVFRHKVKEAGLDGKIKVDSAGTGNWHIGQPPHKGTRKLLDVKGISYSGIAGRQVQSKDFQAFRYIIAMDANNRKDLLELAGNLQNGELKLLMDFVPGQTGVNVPDPYYTGNFDEVYGMVDEGCSRLLDYIRAKEGI